MNGSSAETFTGSTVIGVKLRPFPYPFRCGLAISSDIDLCPRSRFIAIHRVLNRDLGLPVADSFFGCAMNRKQLGLVNPDGSPGPDSDFLLDAIATGCIDTLHSWGDFNDTRVERDRLRVIAEAVCDLLAKRDLSVRLWVNHGSAYNDQNLLSANYPRYQGDCPSSHAYAADLARRVGIRFYCPTTLTSWPLSCARQSPLKIIFRCTLVSLTNVVKTIVGRGADRTPLWRAVKLCQRIVLRDATPIWAVTRYNNHPCGKWYRPTRHTLRYALHDRFLNELISSEGYAVVYTHLGLPVEQSEELFPLQDLNALIKLSRLYHDGIVWVCPAANLLTYYVSVRCIQWHAMRRTNSIDICVTGIFEPLSSMRDLLPSELAGITWYTPDPSITRVLWKEKSLYLKRNPADVTGQESVSIPLPPQPAFDFLGG